MYLFGFDPVGLKYSAMEQYWLQTYSGSILSGPFVYTNPTNMGYTTEIVNLYN